MSAIVLEFVKPKKAAAAPSEKAHYFCQKCHGETFKAFANGQLDCAGCGARMRNIFVGVKVEKA